MRDGGGTQIAASHAPYPEEFMARALVGFVGGPTVSQTRETALLHRRVSDLEAMVRRLQEENDALNDALSERVDELSTADLLEPVAH